MSSNPPISSTDVFKVIKHVIHPILKEDGFTKIKGRNAFRYHEDLIIGFSTHAVGAYFADVTGYTPMSFGAKIWVNYQAIPAQTAATIDKDGTILPVEMHRSLELSPVNLRLQARIGVRSPAEQKRTDLWWISPDGKNIEEMVDDLRLAYKQQASQWFSIYMDINRALDAVDPERECPCKWEFMYFLAKSVANTPYIEKYQPRYLAKQQQLADARMKSSTL